MESVLIYPKTPLEIALNVLWKRWADKDGSAPTTARDFSKPPGIMFSCFPTALRHHLNVTWTPSCWAPCNQHTRQLLKEGMWDGLHHIIAIHGHEMAFLPQWCPSDMPVPSTAAPSAHRSTHPGSPFYCRSGSGLEENLWQGHNLQSLYGRNKHPDYLVWFKWWLLLKCPVLLLNTMILQLEANSSAGGHRNVSPATFYWEVWTERIIAFTRAAYPACLTILYQCACYGYGRNQRFIHEISLHAFTTCCC